jgi:hypothetical protein
MRMFKQLAGAFAAAMCIAGAADGQVVISQVYGGGGNSGATFTHDFIELKNIGTTPQALDGWSVQWSSATSSTWNVTPLTNFTLQPGQYYLIQQAQGAGGTTPLPTPDATGTITMGGSNGKGALVSNTTALSGTCPTGPEILDLVGVGGTATCAEGFSTPNMSNTNAAIRLNGGCQDTNDNSADFQIAAPTPRNSATSYGPCGGTPPTGFGSPNPFTVCNGANVEITAFVTPGTDPASTGITVVGNLSSLGGSASQSFMDLGGNSFSFTQTVGAGTSAGLKTLTLTVSDAQGRNSNFAVDVLVDRCNPSSTGLIEPQALCTTGGLARVVVFAVPASGLNAEFLPGSITADLSLLGGSATQQLFNDATNGDRVADDVAWSYEFAVGPYPVGVRTITWTGLDASARPISGMAEVQFIECTPVNSNVVISQVYGGGGNTGATYTHDFIEIFNRGQSQVDVTGWSVQYASTAGGFSNKTDLPAVILEPGQYLLVRGAAGSSCGMMPCGDPLPVAEDVAGGINLSASSGKVALVSSTTLIGSNCADATVVDLVAFGTGTSCQEGLFGAPSGSNAFALFRLEDGCQDTDQNAVDFFPFAPAPRNTSSAFNVCAGGPATGACCLTDGTCSVQTAANCASMGGSYLGDGEACNQATCDALSVACCLSGSCTVTNLGGCLFQGGTVDSFSGSCTGVDCGPAFCDADWCQDGTKSVADIFCFLADWFALDPDARTYGGAGTPVQAIFAWLAVWFATPNGPCTP